MIATDHYLVVDTEGNPLLSEIAIVNSEGKLIYQAFNQDHPDKRHIQINSAPLTSILQTLIDFAQTNVLIFHYAEHDLGVLKYSMAFAGVSPYDFKTECTCEWARHYFPGLDSYALDHLSRTLNLRVDQSLFNQDLAHSASYDAAFTHQLYLKIRAKMTLQSKLATIPNPFSSSRVDTPFQHHPDFQALFKDQYQTLQSALTSITQDPQHQSKGVMIIGEPGAGKTHLIMRLAQASLKENRILFIRQPTTPSILFHTYSRALDSLIQPVPGTQNTQLEYLLINCYMNFLEQTNKTRASRIRDRMGDDPLQLLNIGKEDSQERSKVFKSIETQLCNWWIQHYSGSGYSLNIIKGIIKYCYYKKPDYKDSVTRWLAANDLDEQDCEKIGLPNWGNNISRNEFSLEAIAVLSRLSILDHPLIMVFDQLEGLFQPHNKEILINFGEAIKEIFTHVPNSLIILTSFPDRWEQFKQKFDGSIVDRVSQYVVELKRPEEKGLRQILKLKLKDLDVELTDLFEQSDLLEILDQPSIRSVINRASAYYQFRYQGAQLPPLVTKTSSIPLDETDSEKLDRVSREAKTLKGQLTQLVDEVSTLKEQLVQILDLLKVPTGPLPHLSDLTEVAPSNPLQHPNDLTQEAANTPVLPTIPLPDIQPTPITSPNNDETVVLEHLHRIRAKLEVDLQLPYIYDEADDIGKIKTIIEAFKRIRAYETEFIRRGKAKVPEHIVIKNNRRGTVIAFIHSEGSAFTSMIKKFNSFVINYKTLTFVLLREARSKPISKGTKGEENIKALQVAPNGTFRTLTITERLDMELIYELITDIQNRDIDIDLETALEIYLDKWEIGWLMSKVLLQA